MRAVGCIFIVLAGLAMAPARADSLFESLGKATGLVAPTPDPPDFVKASRPASEPEAIPAFASPQEPHSKVKSAAELKAMDTDLENASSRQRKRLGVPDPPPDAPKSKHARTDKGAAARN
jgi:hypothetical protein